MDFEQEENEGIDKLENQELHPSELKLFDEMNDKEQEMFSKTCLKAAMDLITSLAIQDGIDPVNLGELFEKYKLLVGKESEEMKKLIKYTGFLQYQAVMLYSASIADTEMKARKDLRDQQEPKNDDEGIDKLGLD